MGLFAALAATFVSLSVGYAYAREIWVTGWQLWTWLVCVLTAAAALLIGAGQAPRLRLGSVWPWLVVLLFGGLALRLILVERVPGGLHVDEVGVADFSLRHVFYRPDLTVNPFRTGPVSQPSLYHYLIRLSLAVGGLSIAGLRLLSTLAGTAAILATYALIAQIEGRRAALFAATLMATYHFHIHWSRLGLNNIWDTLWVPLMLLFFTWGWRAGWSGGAVLSGLAAGLAQYFYAGSRLGLIMLVWLAWRLWREERDTRRLVSYGGRWLIMAACTAAPLAMFALRDPEPFFNRSRIVFGWTSKAATIVTGSPPDWLAYAWHQLWRSAGAFTAVPDVTGFYGPGVPLLIGLAGPLFIMGLLWALYRRRWLPLIWIGLTVMLGGFMLADPPGSSHYVVGIPAICWLMALPLDWLAGRGWAKVALLLLFIIVMSDLLFYFWVYVPSGPRDLIHAFPNWPP